MTTNYILAVLQDATDGKDLQQLAFSRVCEAIAWMRSNCKPGKINGTLFEINGKYDFSVGFVEFSSNGSPITKSLDNESVLLAGANLWNN
jgi:hypothetical protein